MNLIYLNFYKYLATVVIGIILLFGFSTIVEARHLKLYGQQRPAAGITWATYTNDFIPSSAVSSSSGDAGNVILHEIEIETGINDYWSQSIYFDGDSQFGSPDSNDNNSRLSLIKTEFNLSVLQSNLFDFRLNNEWAFTTGDHTEPLAQEIYSNSIELRPIFSKNIGSFTLIMGPGFSYRYTEEPKELTHFYANAIQYRLSDKITTGLEFHGDLGNLRASSEQSHFIVPNIDIQIHEKALLSIGVGIGLNDQSEKYLLRNSLQFSYRW